MDNTRMAMTDLLRAAREWCASGHPVALARVIAAHGSSPRPIGSCMIIRADGHFAGSVSGGCVEGEVIRIAGEVLVRGKARSLHVREDADPLTDIALDCGGDVTIFVEPLTIDHGLLPAFAHLLACLESETPCTFVTRYEDHPAHWVLDAQGTVVYGSGEVVRADPAIYAQTFAPQTHLVVVGADAIGQAVAGIARQLGWRVTVVDPRAAWLTPERFPHVRRVIDAPDHALACLALNPTTAVVVLSHDPKLDEPALMVALTSDAHYVGALGSRAATDARNRRLHALGLCDDQLARLHAPIGLDLGGHTPHEIALSIMAEIVAVQHGRPGGSLRAGDGPIHADATAAPCELPANDH